MSKTTFLHARLQRRLVKLIARTNELLSLLMQIPLEASALYFQQKINTHSNYLSLDLFNYILLTFKRYLIANSKRL